MCEIALADHDNREKELEYKRWMRAAKAVVGKRQPATFGQRISSSDANSGAWHGCPAGLTVYRTTEREGQGSNRSLPFVFAPCWTVHNTSQLSDNESLPADHLVNLGDDGACCSYSRPNGTGQ
jgi:hypothetical protein